MNLNDHLEKLRYFYTTAQYGSMSLAAKSCGISQPSLTKSIKTLEFALDTILFIRLPRGVMMSEVGKELYQFCENLFESVQEFERSLEHYTDKISGPLRVGTYDSISIYLWPQILKKFLPLYPEVKFELITGRSREIESKLLKGEVDLAFIVEPQDSPKVEVQILRHDYFNFYQSTKKRIFKNKEEAPIILMDDAIISGSKLGNKIKKHSSPDKQFYKTSSLESVKELTLNGLGIGLLPNLVAMKEVRSNNLEKIRGKRKLFKHSLGLSYLKSRKNSPALQVLIDELKSSI